MTIPHPESPSIVVHPTKAQVEALGLLMLANEINGAHFTGDLSYRLRHGLTWTDIQELVGLRLCHRTRQGWSISSRLLREWEPYQLYRKLWNKLDRDYWLMVKEANRQSVFGVPLTPDRPYDAPPARLADGLATIRDLMNEAVMGTGSGLAHHWRQWQMEDEERRHGA